MVINETKCYGYGRRELAGGLFFCKKTKSECCHDLVNRLFVCTDVVCTDVGVYWPL